MNEIMVQNWNAVIKKKGTQVYHLGDFGFHNPHEDDIIALRKRLNGSITLIPGNHDDHLIKFPGLWERVELHKYIKTGFKQDGVYVKAFLCHYPMRTWRGSHRGTYCIHGHCHGNLPDEGLRLYDVGVDVRNFAPVDLGAVHEVLKEKIYRHHHMWSKEEKEDA
jgi:calcineurin-like phosphoesterase family protein